MRSKRGIENLARKSSSVDFPTAVSMRFDAFRADLLDVLRQNDLGGDWDWDPHSQRFYTSWEDRSGPVGGDVGMTLVRHVDLDPRADLAGEIERLIAVQEAFRETCKAIRRGACVATGMTEREAGVTLTDEQVGRFVRGRKLA